MTDAQLFFAVWFGAILTLAFCVALHPLAHRVGRRWGDWRSRRAGVGELRRHGHE